MTASHSSPAAAFALIASATALTIAGTDLFLPAAPSLPAALGGTAAQAQLTLASFVAGTGAGLLAYGAAAASVDPRRLLVGSLALFGAISLAAAAARSLDQLIALRFAQGAASAAPAVFAPGFIRALYSGHRAVRMMGVLGSVESLVPALAPVLGAWLLARFGWASSFVVTGAAAWALAALLASSTHRLPAPATRSVRGSYAALLASPAYLRYASSQAFALGGLLVFVFGAPAVIVGPMHGALSNFIWLQIVGIAFFILGANLSARFVARFGDEKTMRAGAAIAAVGASAIFVYGALGGARPLMLIPLSVVLNLGFGLRGPPCFLRAVAEAKGDDARGAALVSLGILLTAAVGTALAAPTVSSGLLGIGATSAAICVASLLLLLIPEAARRSEPSN